VQGDGAGNQGGERRGGRSVWETGKEGLGSEIPRVGREGAEVYGRQVKKGWEVRFPGWGGRG